MRLLTTQSGTVLEKVRGPKPPASAVWARMGKGMCIGSEALEPLLVTDMNMHASAELLVENGILTTITLSPQKDS